MQHDADRLRAERARSLEQQQTWQDSGFYQRLGLEVPEPAATEATFLISIYCERWTQEDLEHGQFSQSDAIIEREAVDADELQRVTRDHGMDSPSASDPRHVPYLWFSSSAPREDCEYFEQGVQKYYSLHIHDVNGHQPDPSDYQRIADLIGVRFDHPLQHEGPAHDTEGPELCP